MVDHNYSGFIIPTFVVTFRYVGSTPLCLGAMEIMYPCEAVGQPVESVVFP